MPKSDRDFRRASVFGGDLEDPDRFLYHYTTRQAALGSILPLRQVRLGPLTWMNDPKDAKPWIVGLSSTDGQAASADFFRIVYETDQLIKRRTKVACLTRDDPTGLRTSPYGNFARGWGHSRMWAQYAEGHSGVCLVFSKEDLLAAVKPLGEGGELWTGPVLYDNGPRIEHDAALLHYDDIVANGLEKVVERHLCSHHQGLFFVKSCDWASEQEFRIVVCNREPGPAFADISTALVAVILGEDFPAGDGDLLTSLCERFDYEISIGRCWWKNGYPLILPNIGSPPSIDPSAKAPTGIEPV